MPTATAVKPTQKAVKTYDQDLQVYADQGVDNESAVRSAFQKLLDQTGRRFGWTLIPELALPVGGRTVQPDGTPGGIPGKVFDYRLGNRSALEWVIDQYRVKTDKRNGIRSDPNRPDDPEYIVRLIGQVVHVSLETVKIVEGLPEDFGGGSD
jgi:hypothetical protein